MIIDLITNPEDPRRCQYGAYLDGAPLNLCLLADEEAGRAVTVKFTHTPAGDRLIEQDASGEAILVEHRGHIELHPTERP